MKRIILLLTALFLLTLTLASCGVYNPPVTTDKVDVTADSTAPQQGEKPADGKFTASLKFNGALFKPEGEITVQWTDEFNLHQATLDDEGMATVTGLDGDYTVTVFGLPEGYAYNPNAKSQLATNDKPHVDIEVYKIIETGRETGSDLYNHIINISSPGIYRVELKNEEQVVFYQFVPQFAGTYVIESWADTTAQVLNPKIDVYYGSVAYKTFAYTKDDGGVSDGFTKNFSYTVEIDDSQFSEDGRGGQAVYAFGVKASVRGNKYPAYVDISLTLDGGYEMPTTQTDMMVPYDLYQLMRNHLMEFQRIGYDAMLEKVGYVGLSREAYDTFCELDFAVDETKDAEEEAKRVHKLFLDIWNNEIGNGLYSPIVNCLRGLYEEGGQFVGAESAAKNLQNRFIFDGGMYRFNEKTGVYHLYDAALYTSGSLDAKNREYAAKYGEGYGPILYAHITSNCRFLDESFYTVEYRGNKALTVSNGTENYKHFIEGWARMLNGMGDVPGAYCSKNCNCYVNPSDVMGDKLNCVQNNSACTPGCMTCDSACNYCPEELLRAPGYAQFVNSDGNFPVTPEIKDFLQKYSVNQLLFFDGNGWVEENPTVRVDATEENQWLFACGYYR